MSTDSDNSTKYKKAFIEVFSITEDKVTDELEYNSIPEWDSLGHMSLVAELENALNISMETDDIINFSSYKKGKEILKKYNVDL